MPNSSEPEHQNITIRKVTDLEDPGFKGFVRTYCEAFGGAPYFEEYTEAEVREVWDLHVPYCLLLAEVDGEVVGLSCCHPFQSDLHPSVYSFLEGREDLPFPLDQTVYMSEVAVLMDSRGNGLGMRLIKARLIWASENGWTHYAMRTANEGSHSVRLYERLGATRAPFVQDVRGDSREIATASNQRQYLWGTTS